MPMSLSEQVLIVKEYPQYEGVPVRIQIDCIDEPTDERTQRFLEGVGMVCEQNSVNFLVRVIRDEST